MNAVPSAKTAYNSTSMAPVRTSRGTEYEVFARVTRNIQSAASTGKTGFGKLAQALHDNRRLWTLLAADVSENENGLPADLRARIFYLSEFTADHSRKVLSEGESADILIEINTAMMRGLRQMTEAA